MSSTPNTYEVFNIGEPFLKKKSTYNIDYRKHNFIYFDARDYRPALYFIRLDSRINASPLTFQISHCMNVGTIPMTRPIGITK